MWVTYTCFTTTTTPKNHPQNQTKHAKTHRCRCRRMYASTRAVNASPSIKARGMRWHASDLGCAAARAS